MNDLVTLKDVPTHRLTVKLEDGSFKVFYITEQEAVWLTKSINSVEPNLILPKSIDPAAPSFYPKRGSWMERMTKEEITARSRRYAHTTSTIRDQVSESRKKEDNAKARAWIEANPEQFLIMQREAEKKLNDSKGIYHSASDGTKACLIKYEALRNVYVKLGLAT